MKEINSYIYSQRSLFQFLKLPSWFLATHSSTIICCCRINGLWWYMAIRIIIWLWILLIFIYLFISWRKECIKSAMSTGPPASQRKSSQSPAGWCCAQENGLARGVRRGESIHLSLPLLPSCSRGQNTTHGVNRALCSHWLATAD